MKKQKDHKEKYKALLELCADKPENRFAVSRFSKHIVQNALKWKWITRNNNSNYEITEKGVYQLENGVRLPIVIKMRKPTMNEAVVLYSLDSVGIAWEPKKRYERAVKACLDNGWITTESPASVTPYGLLALKRIEKPPLEWNTEKMRCVAETQAKNVKYQLDGLREALLKKRDYVIFGCEDMESGPCFGMQLVVRYNARRIGRVQKWRFGLPIGRWIYIDGAMKTLKWVARQIECMGPKNKWSIYVAERNKTNK